jgi:polysaccharide biosynthesis transport protein
MNSMFEQVMTVLYAIWRKRWYGLAATWAVCLVGWVTVALIPNEFESDARIYAKWSNILADKIGFQAGEKLAQIDVVRQTLTSRPNLEKVVRRTDLATQVRDDADLDGVIQTLTDSIEVKSQQDNLFTITFVSKNDAFTDAQNAAMAQRVVQNLINIFVEENISSDRDNLNQAIRFLEDQLAERARELEEAEKRRSEFEQKYMGRLPGQGNISERLMQAQDDLEKVELELNQASSSLRSLASQIRSTPETIDAPLFNVGNDGGLRYDPTSARGRIEVLERQISDAYGRGWTDQHPDIVTARMKIRQLEAAAAKEPKEPKRASAAAQSNPVYANLRSLMFDRQSAVAALSARRNALKSDIDNLQSRQIEEPGIAAEQSKISRDYDVLKRQYDELLKSREEVRLRSDVENKTDQVQFQIVDPPSLPRAPVAPDRPLLLTAVLVGGLVAGIAVSFLISQIHTTFMTPGKLEEAFGVPVLGNVSEIVTEQDRAQRRIWLMAFGVAAIGLIGIFAILMIYQVLSQGGA